MNNVLKYLKSINETIVLKGHDTIDVDSAISCILFSKFLSYNNISNKIVICDKKIHETDLKIMKIMGYDLNKYKGIIKNNEPMFLLDHYVTDYSKKVVGCIDHHPNNQDINYPIYINKRSGSTGKLIYDLMLEYDYPLKKEDIELVVLSIMVDTSSLKSTKCPEEHKQWVKNICEEYNIDYQTYYDMGLCLSDLQKPIEEVVSEGFKKYIFSGISICSSYIQVNIDNIQADQYISYIVSLLKNRKEKLWVFLIHNFFNNCTTEYRITLDGTKIIKHNKITSRGSTIMPEIEKNITKIITI